MPIGLAQEKKLMGAKLRKVTVMKEVGWVLILKRTISPDFERSSPALPINRYPS